MNYIYEQDYSYDTKSSRVTLPQKTPIEASTTELHIDSNLFN